MEITKDKEMQILESKTEAIVNWLKLSEVPEAIQFDPDGKLGLEGAFVKRGGFYVDPIPQNVIDQAKRNVLGGKTNGEPIRIPLLEPTDHPKITIPLFREQVFSAVQYIAKLGFELPLPEGTEGEGFVMVGHNVTKKPEVTSTTGVFHETFKTKDPNIFVDIGRRGALDGPATSIKLRIQK